MSNSDPKLDEERVADAISDVLKILGQHLTGLPRQATLDLLTNYERVLIRDFIEEKEETWLRWFQGALAVVQQLKRKIEGAPKALKLYRENGL